MHAKTLTLQETAMPDCITFRNPATVAPPFGPYSHVAAVRMNAEVLYFSGQVGLREDGSIPEFVDEQYEMAVKTIDAILKDCGLSSHNIVKLTTYLVKPLAADRLRAIRHSVFGDIAPAATLLYVPRLAAEGLYVEIDVVAARLP
jgi:2-iminobutanoate/2-iminopropanoate deaminase